MELFPSDEAFQALVRVRLSVRARNVLQKSGITSAQAFLALTEAEARRLRNCGRKTIEEFAALQQALRSGEWSEPEPMPEVEPSATPMGMGPLPTAMPSDEAFQALVRVCLSVRARNVLQKSGITSAQAFLALTEAEAWQCRNCGRTTISEFSALQRLLCTGTAGADMFKTTGLPDWEEEVSWEALFGHLMAFVCKGRMSHGAELTARWRLGFEPGLLYRKTLEEVGTRLGVSRERVRQQEIVLRKELSYVLQAWEEPLSKLANRVRACLDRPQEGVTALETLADFLRGNGYRWLKEAGEVLPLLRLLRLAMPTLTVGWGVANGRIYAWWNLRTAFGEAWSRLETVCRMWHTVPVRANALTRWYLQQEKTQEWPDIRFLVTLLGGDHETVVEECEEAWTALVSEKETRVSFRAAVKALGEQIAKGKKSSTYRQELILESLKAGPLNLDELFEAIIVRAPELKVSRDDVRSAVARLEAQKDIQMVGNLRYALASRLAPEIVADAEAFLRAQFVRGGVACGFVYQVFQYCRNRLPKNCTVQHFFAMLRDDPAFGLCAKNYPCVSLREGLTTRANNTNGRESVWEHLRSRLEHELPISATRMEEIWCDWFGGSLVHLADRLSRFFHFKAYRKADGTRWYVCDEIAPAVSSEDETTAKAFEVAIATFCPAGIELSQRTAVTFLEGVVKRSLTPSVMVVLRSRLFEREDGRWVPLSCVCPEDTQRALVSQCVEWLRDSPLVTLAKLSERLSFCPLLREERSAAAVVFVRKCLSLYVTKAVEVHDGFCIRHGAKVRQAEKEMAYLVAEAVMGIGATMPLEELSARFPSLDAGWFSRRWPMLCEQADVVASVEDDNALILPPQEREACSVSLRVFLCNDPGELRFDALRGWLAACLGSPSLLKRLVKMLDPHGRNWHGEIFGAQKPSLLDLADNLSQPFTLAEINAVGRARCGWQKGLSIGRLWKVCLRLGPDQWMTPKAFCETVRWDDALTREVTEAYRAFLGKAPFFAFSQITKSQLAMLPSLCGELAWTSELAESVAAILPLGVRLLGHAMSEGIPTGFLVPDDAPDDEDGLLYLTRLYRTHHPSGTTAEDLITFIVDEVRVRSRRTDALRRQVEACFAETN